MESDFCNNAPRSAEKTPDKGGETEREDTPEPNRIEYNLVVTNAYFYP